MFDRKMFVLDYEVLSSHLNLQIAAELVSIKTEPILHFLLYKQTHSYNSEKPQASHLRINEFLRVN